MKIKVLILLLIVNLLGVLFAQIKVNVELDKKTILTINGSTNLLSFKLNQYGDQILNKPISLTASKRGNKLFLSQNKLSIGVSNFKSNNPIAQSEFYKLMKADQYPYLKIQLNSIDSLLISNNSEFSKGIASMNFTITGVTKQYSIPIIASGNKDFLIVTGSRKMTIKDFGLEPPVTMLGLIKVSEWIEIEFKVLCKLTLENNNSIVLK